MGDFSKISGSYYRQTKDTMEPEKEREKDPNDLFSAATAIKRMNEQGGSDDELRAKGPYPSTADTGPAVPDAPPTDIEQKDLSTKGADDATAGDQDFSKAPVTKQGANEQSNDKQEQDVTERNAHNNT